MSADYEGASMRPAPGVYRAVQGEAVDNLVQELAQRMAKVRAEAYEEGYRYALRNLDDEGVDADRQRYTRDRTAELEQELAKAKAETERLTKGWEQAYQQGWRQGQDQRLEWRRERDKARAHAEACREDADRNAARAEKAEQALAHVNRERDHLRGVVAGQEAAVASMVEEANRYRDERNRAREQAAECMREVAQLHRQLDSLGTNPDRLAEQVGAGMAVTLFGRTYVARDQDDKQVGEGTYLGSELLEAQGGVFVPIPKGHMLSVTVTPYEDQPAD